MDLFPYAWTSRMQKNWTPVYLKTCAVLHALKKHQLSLQWVPSASDKISSSSRPKETATTFVTEGQYWLDHTVFYSDIDIYSSPDIWRASHKMYLPYLPAVFWCAISLALENPKQASQVSYRERVVMQPSRRGCSLVPHICFSTTSPSSAPVHVRFCFSEWLFYYV